MLAVVVLACLRLHVTALGDEASAGEPTGPTAYRFDSRKLANAAAGARAAAEAPRRVDDDGDAAAPEWRERSLRVVTSDGKRFELDLEYATPAGERRSLRRSGTAAEIVDQSQNLPPALRDDIARSLDEAAREQERKPGVRFRLQPGLRGTRRNVRVQLSHPGEGGVTRMLEVEQDLEADRPLNVDRLLQHEQLADELDRLPPEVRRQVEQTLRTVRLPEVRVQVRRSQ
ncbi:MAG: hypothetical protein WED34_17300 [Planctomycetales bacterium]